MKKFSLIITTAVLITGGFAVPSAFGMPDISIIEANCVSAQSVLNQIQKADTGSRINRGYDYNEILNLMFAMNARLSVNKIAAPTLTDLASQLEHNLAKFRSDYDSYADTLSSVLNVKCTNRPLDFYSRLEIARTARETLSRDVAALDQNIKDYYDQFDIIIKGTGRQ